MTCLIKARPLARKNDLTAQNFDLPKPLQWKTKEMVAKVTRTFFHDASAAQKN
jgi:hypothetical protein